MNNTTVIGGYVSVKSVIEAKSRDVHSIIIEKSRYDSVLRSDFHVTEKRQYEALMRSGIDCQYVDTESFSKLNAGSTAGGIAAVVGERKFLPFDEVLNLKNGYIAMLDGIEDPFNFAYALRSLYAAGCDGVILPERNFFSATETVIRSSAGASERISACVCADLADACKKLSSKGYTIASTAKTENAKDLYRVKVSRPICVVFGGEKRGIKKEIIDASDVVLKIKYPRACHYSLPACSAISIISFELAKKMEKR